MTSLLRVDRLSKRYGGLHAVRDVSFDIESGQIVGLIGDNGAGKTTLFNLLSGFVTPSSGRVRFQADEITRWSPERRAQAGLVRTFQRSRIFPEVSVEQNVRMGCFLRERRRFVDRLRLLRGSPRSMEERVDELLDLTGLAAFRQTLAAHLSFGYQRRLAVAVALGADPQMMLLDEPFGGLSPTSAEQMGTLIHALHERGMTLLLIEHRMESIVASCDRLLVMQGGELIIPRSPAETEREAPHALG